MCNFFLVSGQNGRRDSSVLLKMFLSTQMFAGELLKALKMEHVWKELVPLPLEDLQQFDECKDVFMGMSWATVARTPEDKEDEVSFLRESLEKFF